MSPSSPSSAVATTSGSGSSGALVALAMGAFAFGTAELVIVGLLNLVASDLAVSEADVGRLVTAYALGIAIGGPLLTLATARVGRTALIELALAGFLAVNVVIIVAGSLDLIIFARVAAGAIHGMFIGTAVIVAAQLVPPERSGQAISMVFGGIAVSTVLGVPLGTLVGETLGWRATFGLVVALTAIALLATVLRVPRIAATPRPTGGGAVRAAFAPRVVAVLAFGLFLLGGQFVALTYLTPFLGSVTGISGSLASAYLLAFGLAAAAGTVFGGRAADRNASLTLACGTAALAVALGLLYALGSSPALSPILLAMWGFAGFGLLPALQLRVIGLAGSGADLASTLAASAVNAGIAIGSLVGGAILNADGARSTVLLAFVLCVIAIPIAIGLSRIGSGRQAAVAPRASEKEGI